MRTSGRRPRIVRASVLTGVLLAVGGLSACAETGVSAADAYKIGCPAVDSAVGGGSVLNRATVGGLKALRDSRQLGDEAQQWLESSITLLESSSPNDLPADAKRVIVDGCADNGYPLRNLKS